MGERRFRAPEYVDASDRIFEAKYYGKNAFGALGYGDCIQKIESEDCLYLNIWVNTDDKTEKKPVMVWIHGGGFFAESLSSPLYDLTSISKQHPDILFVSIDYRLGFMGFMNFERVPGGDDRQTMVFDDTIGMQKDMFGRREDLMMSWAERLGNGSSKRVC